MTRYVLWEFNVRAHDFAGQVEAAAAGGFDVLTMPIRKYRQYVASGLNAADMVRIAEDAGVTLDFLDGFSGWLPIRYPAGNEMLRAYLDFSEDEAFEICDALGLKTMVVIGAFEPGALSAAQLNDEFARLCERAAAADMRVDLEAMPNSGIGALRAAWDILRASGAANADLTFDTGHFMKGDPDFAFLEALPRGAIIHAQLKDRWAVPRGATPWEDTMDHTMLPGEADLPIAKMLDVLRRTQTLETIGPEAHSLELDRLSPREAGIAAANAVRVAMLEAGYESGPTPRQGR